MLAAEGRSLGKDGLAIAKSRRAVWLLKVWLKLPGPATPAPSGLEKLYHELSSLPSVVVASSRYWKRLVLYPAR